MISDSYTGNRRLTRDSRRPVGPWFIAVLVLSVTATLALLVLAVVYYAGSSARIAGDYVSIATPADRVLTVERARYADSRRHDLAAARSALMKEVTTVRSFDNQLEKVTFPAAAAAAAPALVKADQRLAILIWRQAHAPSLGKMRSSEFRAGAAAAAVKVQVGRIREALGLARSSGPLY